jgi:uncharacterized membrane protein (UPF0127 family)
MFVKRLGLAIAITIVFGLFIFLSNRPQKGSVLSVNTVTYNLEGKQYRLLVAKTPEEHQKGLMYFRKLDNADGMIFLFDDKNYRTFWNKNTLMDLDVYWIDDDKVIGKDYLPSVEKSKNIVTISSPKLANKVIELINK